MRPSMKLSLVIGLTISAGCTPEKYNVSTEIDSDGSIARRVILPDGERLPDSGRKDWTKTRIARDYDSAVTSVATSDSENESQTTGYFVAEGTFKRVSLIPDHYEQTSVDGSRSGRLKRDYTKNDYGFFVEHIWSEELTDPVHPEEFPAAVQKLARFVAKFNELGLREYLGNDIDIQQVTEWIENDGAQIALESLLLGMHLAGRRDEQLFIGQDGQNRLRQIALGHGIDFGDNNSRTALDRFLRAELSKRLRYNDGRPIEDDRLRIVIQFYMMQKDDDDDENACAAAFRRAAERTYGEEFDQQLAILTPLLGVYGDRILGTPQTFQFSLKLPGLIVETNGLLVSDAETRWTFDASDATIFGYRMTCRSIERNDKLCDHLLQADTLRTRGDLIKLFDLAQDEYVKSTLLDVAKKGSGLYELPNDVRELLRRK